MIRDTTKIFDVNVMYDEWYLTVDEGSIKICHFEPSIKVLQVVDGKNIIWNNEHKHHVAGIKIKHGDEGPENCEIFCKTKLNEIRYIYVRDDLGWHFINTAKCPVEESKLKRPSISVHDQPKKDVEPKGAEEGQMTKRAFRRPGKYELIVTTDERSPYKLPDYVDAGDYTICGFIARVYDCNKATVTRVSDGFKLLWFKTEDTYLEKVTVLYCEHSEELLLEIEYIVRRPKDLGPIKGLKTKNWMNRHYYEYDYFIKSNGIWESKNKVDFVTHRQKLVKEYMFKNRHKQFDSSFGTFFDEVHDKPLESLDTRKLITYDSFQGFFKSFYRRFFKPTVPISYDLKTSPEFLFKVRPHYIFSNFILCKLDQPYALVRMLDGNQIIWNQGENGLGVTEFFYYFSEDLHLLHLLIDAHHEKNKYYHKRRGYWYEIEQEEHIKLLNDHAKTKRDKRFTFKNRNYVIVEGREEQDTLETSDGSSSKSSD